MAEVPIDPATVGSISGVVHFKGSVPAPSSLGLGSDPGCARLHPQGSDAVVQKTVVTDGLLERAFVYIKKGLENRRYEVPTEEIILDQRACIYEPRVIGVRARQAVTFINSDPLLHNVRSSSRKNRTFNISMPTKDLRTTRMFKKAEVMVKAKCDVHPWMRSFIGVMKHPHFAVTGNDGAFDFPGVPPGDYVVAAWHEVLGSVSATLTVPERGSVSTSLEFVRP